jgi:GTPase involved in cell partitioning and DNA repair
MWLVFGADDRRDPVRDFDVIMSELGSFSEDLATKPMILVATKMDVAQDPSRIEALSGRRTKPVCRSSEFQP